MRISDSSALPPRGPSRERASRSADLAPSPRHPRWRFAALIALVMFALASPSGARAQDGARTEIAVEAELQFDLGNAAFEEKRFAQALSHYFTSNRLAPNRNLQLNIALCYEQLGQFVEAHRFYASYEEGSSNPDEKKALAKAIARLKPRISLLRIESDPPGATIYLNRKELGSYGVTPRNLAVEPGGYTVLLERVGYKDITSAAVDARRGQEASVTQKLERILGRLEVSGAPEGARFSIEGLDGVVEGVVPATVELTPGEHTVTISSDGFVSQVSDVSVEALATTRLKAALVQEVGSLVVQADEENALITIDDEPSGFTPAVIDSLPVGTHQIRISLQGFRDAVYDVEVLPDRRVVIEAQLEVSEDISAASRGSDSLRDAPASVSLITRREIEAFNYVHAADALLGTRGMSITDDAGYLSMGVRGFSPFGQYGNRLQTQIDGHTINENWIGSSFIGFDLMPHLYELDRIEVVRGPSSVLYGTNAFFGVVNFVTPYRALPQHTVSAGVTAVSDGTVRPHVSANASFEDGGVWVSGGGVYAQGQPIGKTFPEAVATGSGSLDDINGSQGGGLLGALWWRDLSVHWYFNEANKTYNEGAYETLIGDERGSLIDRRAYAEVRYSPKINDWFSLPVRVYYDHYSYLGGFPYEDDDGGLNTEEYLGDWVGTELRAEFTPFEGTRIDVGAEYQYHLRNSASGEYQADGEVYLDESHPYQLFSAYLTGDSEIASWFRTSAGVRFDGWLVNDLPSAEDISVREDEFFFSINPRLALIFKPSQSDTIKLMGGRAFRAASVYELTYNDDGFTQIASPGLTPETIYTIEAEYTRRLPADFWLTTAVYGNALLDRIEQAGEGVEDDPLFFTNRDDTVWTLGSEVELRRVFRRGWMFALQYAFQNTRVDEPFGDTELANYPTHAASIKGIAPIYDRYIRLASRISVESARLGLGGSTVEPAVVWDFAFSGEARSLSLKYALGVRNILDWRHLQPAGEDSLQSVRRRPGRTVFADLTFTY